MKPFILNDSINNEYPMIQIDLNEDIWSKADYLSRQLPIYEKSHRGLQANQVGVIGEIIAEMFFKQYGIGFIETKNTQHDYQFLSGRTIDIKTKDRTVSPRLNFDCSVPLYNHEHQQPDYYLFISLQRSRSDNSEEIRRYKKAYILGALNRDILHSRGKVWQGGQTDPANGTKFWTSCINVNAKQLIGLGKAIQSWRKQSVSGAA